MIAAILLSVYLTFIFTIELFYKKTVGKECDCHTLYEIVEALTHSDSNPRKA
jgi:hypothetical protein